MVESAIHNFRNMLCRRLEHEPASPWYGLMLQQVLFTYNYMNTQRTVEMKPNDARKPENAPEDKRNIIKHTRFTRGYPEVKVGDTVRIYHKKKTLDIPQQSVWLAPRYTVSGIKEVNGQSFYRTTWDVGKPRLRPFMLKAPT